MNLYVWPWVRVPPVPSAHKLRTQKLSASVPVLRLHINEAECNLKCIAGAVPCAKNFSSALQNHLSARPEKEQPPAASNEMPTLSNDMKITFVMAAESRHFAEKSA